MLHYLIQIMAFQLFFLIIYDVLLKKETFFNLNRIYLLGTALISVILPFIKIESIKNIMPQNYLIILPEVVVEAPNTILLDELVINGSNITHGFIWYLSFILIIGSTLALLFFMYRIIYILKLAYRNPKLKQRDVFIVNISQSRTAFSFFNYVFIGDEISKIERVSILKHELVHVKQKHTLDLLFFELLRILFWFNPLVYMYQNRVTDLHEFIADSKTVQDNKKQYYESLLTQVFDTKSVSFINQFFKQSLIKKRIIMLQKSKSKQVQLLKYVVLIPIISGMLVYSSCSEEPVSAKGVAQEMTVSDQIQLLKNSLESKDLSESEKRELLELFIQVKRDNAIKSRLNTLADEVGSEETEVPFAAIEQVPVFPGCETSVSETEKRKCMNLKIMEFVTKNFNTELANSLNLSGELKIMAFFKIDVSGNIIDIKVRAPHPGLETESSRVINMLPKMIPGKQGGNPVIVPYYLPIKFNVKA